MIPLRPHQEHALSLLRQSLGRGNRRVIVQAPTGFGKTVLASNIVKGALTKGNRVMFVVPAVSLIDQTVDRFISDGIDAIGVIQSDHVMTNFRHPVQVCSVQTLERRRFPPADVVIIDECHRWFKFFERWMADPEWLKVPFIGLSATPWTKGLGKHFQDLVIACTAQDLIDQGYLSPFRVFAPSHPDLTGVKIVGDDYHEGQLGEVMDKAPLVADVVRTWKQSAEGLPTLLFAVNRAHAKHLQNAFVEAGIPAGYIDAYTDGQERWEIEKQFAAGELKVVCNVGCLTTGIDWDVRCIILARPTRSEMLFVQMVGRGLRTAEGKTECLILDHSDTHLRLGFVTDIHHDTLDTGNKADAPKDKKPEALPKECIKCHFLKPPKVSQCPVCGFKPERTCDVEHVDGELVDITLGRFESKDHEMYCWASWLRRYAKEHGYKDGWWIAKHVEKFGDRHFMKYSHAQTKDEMPAYVSSWIKSQNIRYAKGKQSRDKKRDESLAVMKAMFTK